MEGTRIIDVKAAVLADNQERADSLRQRLKERGVFLVNVMGSPGCGKTSLLLGLLPLLGEKAGPAVIEADLDSAVDADKLRAAGLKAVQLRTGGFCHMDAAMTEAGLTELAVFEETTSPHSIVFLENVGNLICTAQVDCGASLNLALLSVPEGDDKPLKYPPIFALADILVVSKADYLDREAFDMRALRERVLALKPDSEIHVISARTGEGLEKLAASLFARLGNYRAGA